MRSENNRPKGILQSADKSRQTGQVRTGPHAERINTLVVVPSNEKDCSTVYELMDKPLIARVQVLELVNNEVIDLW